MVRILVIIYSIFIGIQPLFAQQSVLSNFGTLVWADEMDGSNIDMWRQATGVDEILLVQGGQYVMVNKNKINYTLVFPNEKMAFSGHKAEFEISLDEENSKTASGGVVVMAQEDGKGAFLIEINGKRQYRISKFNGNTFKPIQDDWVKNKAIKGLGEVNNITICTEEKKYDLYINNQFITAFSEVSYKSGKIALFAGVNCKMTVDFIHIYVTATEKERLKKEAQKKEKEDQADPVLTQVIAKLRTQMLLIEIERDSLRVVIDELKRKEQGGGAANTQKLRAENKEQKAEIDRLKKENAALLKENAGLKDFKETILNGESGDIILTLSKAIETEKERIEILAAENEKLHEEIKRLKERQKN